MRSVPSGGATKSPLMVDVLPSMCHSCVMLTANGNDNHTSQHIKSQQTIATHHRGGCQRIRMMLKTLECPPLASVS